MVRADARENRARILAAARQALAEDGGTSMNQIAQRAGVGPGTLYRNFPTREALVLAVYQLEVDQLIDSVPGLLAALPPLEALRRWTTDLVERHAEEARPRRRAQPRRAPVDHREHLRPGHRRHHPAAATRASATAPSAPTPTRATSSSSPGPLAGRVRAGRPVAAHAGADPRRAEYTARRGVLGCGSCCRSRPGRSAFRRALRTGPGSSRRFR